MSKEYMVLLVQPDDSLIDNIESADAQVFMRFTEKPSDGFLSFLARETGQRVYCLTGASTWFEAERSL